MESFNLQTFLETAERQISLARSSLLVVGQTGGEISNLAVAARALRELKAQTAEGGFDGVTTAIVECEEALDKLFLTGAASTNDVYQILDLVAKIESTLLEMPLLSGGLVDDVAGFLDASFDQIAPQAPKEAEDDDFSSAWVEEEFGIDEETLDIFRSEATDLLSQIANDLARLQSGAEAQSALWDIRRSAHTFKGAAGVVGQKQASKLAHQMEDLLDKLVEKDRAPDAATIDLLYDALNQLGSVVGTHSTGDAMTDLGERFSAAIAALDETSDRQKAAPRTVSPFRKPDRKIHSPIVRVSLERLDDLIRLATKLAANNEILESAIADLRANSSANDSDLLSEAILNAHTITGALVDNLRRVRMQRFGTLETRLNRAVHVTCEEEDKLAALTIENGDVEIDTLLIDALVEPLLHLLRNSVVHGIEPPDQRRLVGKREKGSITVKVRSADGVVLISVEDDGRGILAETLKQRAVKNGVLSYEDAAKLSETEAQQLIFAQGLTTSEKVSLNAGRGVGMSIVKESVENLEGSVEVMSEPLKGTRFVLRVPIGNGASPHKAEKPVQDKSSAPLVLIVDDSASIRKHNTTLVENAGFRTITAKDGVEALEVLLSGSWRPDLILSDVEMPRMDGWQLLETICGSEELATIPVALVTSLDTDDHRLRAAELGASYYFVKPLNVENLKELTVTLN
ncbi:MAG: chemotaxis protein CheA [Acidobacteria bacterium OLB17]|nr:MAG: chemotaxis protein CheA [Acidobacteria bacterium OLB17]MCZ2389893.1 response regulator [Acidobacteriota bacterium]